MDKTTLAAFALVALAGAANADIAPEDFRYAGAVFTDIYGNAQAGGLRGGTTVYSNTASAANAATSSANLNTRWGDRLNMTGTGTLQEFSLTVFNSTTGNTGSILTYDAEVLFYRQSDSSFIGGFTGTINFGAGLNAGFYSVVTFTGLGGLGIDLDTTDILAIQRRVAHTGASVRMGVASLNPVVIGSSPVDFYRDDPSAPPAGYYVFSGGTVPANIGYQVVIPAPGAAALFGVTGLLAVRRRR